MPLVSGDEVRKARKKLGLTQKGYAERIGLTQQSVSLIESGKTRSVAGETMVQLIQRGGLVLTKKGSLRAAVR